MCVSGYTTLMGFVRTRRVDERNSIEKTAEH